MESPSVRSVQWPEVHDWLIDLVAASIDCDSIIGVSRGGVPIAVCLSSMMKNTPLHFAYRDNAPGVNEPFYVFGGDRESRLAENRSRYKLTDGGSFRKPLVVDVVVTFGDTLSIVGELLISAGAAEVRYATYAADVAVLDRERPEIKSTLTYHESIDNSQVWLSFPWHDGNEK
jgi:hypoxanthine phosphoribosyltransferase